MPRIANAKIKNKLSPRNIALNKWPIFLLLSFLNFTNVLFLYAA